MFENEKENGLFMGEGLDLGSNDAFGGFTPFDDPAADAVFGTENKEDNTIPECESKSDTSEPTAISAPESESAFSVQKTVEGTETEGKEHDTDTSNGLSKSAESANADTEKTDEAPDLFAQAIAAAAEKQAESAKSGLADKFPIFSYGSAKEDIVDTSKNFEELRVEKAEDFPELDDASAVSWKMTYGTITKSISTPKKTTIAAMKKQIEDSKEFTAMLTKSGEKKNAKKSEPAEIVCKVTPSVVAKKKGIVSGYKGVFLTPEEAAESGKEISFVPSDNGKVYEIRSNRIGTFVAETNHVTMLRKVRAGFIPALPKIPYKDLSEIITFFKSYVTEQDEVEALAYIYWSFSDAKYYVYVPPQKVSKAKVDATLPYIDEEMFTLVMEIHSHNSMEAVFSPTDDKDERATRLYTVIGRLDKVFPDIQTRASVGGKFIDVEPSEVFEGISGSFPERWTESVEKCSIQKGVRL